MIKRLLRHIAFILLIPAATHTLAQPNDWENPQLVSRHALRPRAWFIPYHSEAAALQKNNPSPWVQSLDGVWKFNLAQTPDQRPAQFYKDDFDVSNWQNIKVPANWQTEGFDRFIFTDVEYPIAPNPPLVPKDFNPVGSYKRNFTVPANWKGKDIILRLGAVNSFFYLWINGQYAGLGKDSKTPLEFDITRLLRTGNNTIALQVFRFSDGTYLEGQDMWKLSGIERSVTLTARPKFCIADFFVQAGLDNNYTDGVLQLQVALNKKSRRNNGDYTEVKLLDDAHHLQEVFTAKQRMGMADTLHFAARIPAVRKWNAETPALYTLLIVHKNKNGKIVEAITQQVGFRSLEIKNGLFLVNGVAIKLKGVNRHEHDMYTGKVITVESMVNDIRIMKQYNINAVRCSHYPNREEWYELCNKYGIYVIDEANIECDGMDFHPLKTLSDKPEWKAAYLDRTQRMFERDKNFTCIIGWSLGNESRWGDNFIATHAYLKSRDKSRPVQYEEARDNPYTDLYVPMYKSIPVWEKYVSQWQARPLILCEYAHMMGNSGGNLKDDWDLFYRYPQLQGGFIWDFSDQAFKKKDAAGREIWAYGRDMGNVGVTSDTSFCADGLFAADRTPHPQAFELQKVYQNIHFEALPASDKMIRVTNRFDFTNLGNYSIHWYIKANGEKIAEGKTGTLQLAPHESKEVALALPDIEHRFASEYFLFLEARTNYATELVPQHFLIAKEQLLLPWQPNADSAATFATHTLQSSHNTKELTLFHADFAVTFNKVNGWLSQVRSKGKELLHAPLVPHFWRAATDNDIGNSQQIRCAVWQQAAADARLDSFVVNKINERQTEVRTVHYLPAVDARYYVQYVVTAGGEVEVQVQMKAGAKPMPELPRFGMQVLLKNEFDKVSWLGRGPFDNYWDRNYAADIDLYSMPADSLFHPYARAQESGYRTDVRWMMLQDKEGAGLKAIGQPQISTGVLHFDMRKLDFDRNAPQNNHGGAMTNDAFISWNIDYKQMGVGGDNSWGAKTHTQYLLPYKDYAYRFVLRTL